MNPAPTPSRPSRFAAPRFGVGLAVLVLLPLLALAACGSREPEPGAREAAPPIAVDTAVAEPVTVAQAAIATASVEPWRRVAPGTKVLGRIEQVRVREGDRVDRGELLARLESRDLEAAVAQAQAAIRMADATLENARIQQQRMAALEKRGSATPKSLEDATAALRVAEATREQAEANLAAARVTLGYAEIRSPLAGTVVEKHVEAGDMATPGTPLFVVEDLSRVKLDARVPEADVVGLERGSAAQAEIAVLGERYDTEVDRVVPAGDPVSRTYSVTLVLDNAGGALKSGMFARVRFPLGERTALLVPESALVERGQLRGLFVVEDADPGMVRGRLQYVKVRDGAEAGTVEILSGLEPGDRYLVAPPPGLADGAPIEERGR